MVNFAWQFFFHLLSGIPGNTEFAQIVHMQESFLGICPNPTPGNKMVHPKAT